MVKTDSDECSMSWIGVKGTHPWRCSISHIYK